MFDRKKGNFSNFNIEENQKKMSRPATSGLKVEDDRGYSLAT
jgi:hypothetical protein